VAVDANGHVCSGSDDGTARVWDLSSGTARHVLPHDGPVRALATAAGRLVTGSDDHRVRLWHTEAGRLEDVMAGHTDVVRAVAVTPDARRVVSGSRDGTAIIWTPGEPSRVLPHGQWMRGVAITANHVMTTSTDGIVRLWQLTDGELVAALTGHRASVRDVAISADGTHAVSTSDDRTARLWDLATGTEPHRDAAAHRIVCCAIDPLDPTRVVLGTSSGEVLEIGTG
jgi:WD40 repeat protein